MLTVTYDGADGIITTVAKGISSSQEFDAYLPGLRVYLGRSSALHGKWLHLVDASANLVQPQDYAAYVAEIWNEKPRDDGYLAYVITSVIAKMQIERMRDNPHRAFFADRASACAWLLAQVAAPSVCAA